MKVLIFHGYMLRGTGSNIYNARLAEALAEKGHEVHLLCQDRETRLRGVQIHNPSIGSLLPVYVRDPYPGFQVKTFPELSEEELRGYLAANVDAVRALVAGLGGVDAALANHLIMGPVILARAGFGPFAAKIHGSALEYTVKPNPRFLPYAREGMREAAGVLVGSRHTADSLWATLPELEDLKAKTGLGPPGVDLAEFCPRPGAAAAVPQVVFVGKLIVSKGVDLLLAAWPLVHAAHPDARLRIVGFGEYEGGLRRLLGALERGDLDDARKVAALGRGLEGGAVAPLPILARFLAEPPSDYRGAAREAAGSVEFIGRLEHDQVAQLLPEAEALVMPSTFPEAFGMVAVEAAACGVLPISADHSGMREVTQQLAPALGAELGALTSFPIGAGAVEAIAARLRGWLGLPQERQELARAALVETVARVWSWGSVAESVLAASAGRLSEVDPPPS